MLVYRIKTGFQKLMQTLLIVLIFWYFFLSGNSSSSANVDYKLQASSSYPHEITTPKLGIKYYVKSTVLDEMKSNQKKFTSVKYASYIIIFYSLRCLSSNPYTRKHKVNVINSREERIN